MKKTVTITGRVELTRQEVSQAIFEYLEAHHNIKSRSIVYTPIEDTFSGAICEISESIDDGAHEFPKLHQKQTRDSSKGHTRPNTGLTVNIKELIDDARRRGVQQLTTNIIFRELREDFPQLTKERLKMYLHDKRQFKDTKYSSRTEILTL